MIVKDLNFRYLCSSYVVIQNRGITHWLGGPAEADAILAGYLIHPENGLCFLPMDTAVFEPYRRMHMDRCRKELIRDSTVRMDPVMPVRLKKAELKELDEIFKPVMDQYSPSDILQISRSECRLDPWRLRQYPDRLVIPVSENCEVTVVPESCGSTGFHVRVIEVSGSDEQWKCGDTAGIALVQSDKKTDPYDLSIWKLK